MSTAPTPVIGKRGADAHVPFTGGFNRTEFFSLPDDGDTEVLRFLTDFQAVTIDGELAGGWPAFKQHQNIPTKAAPSDYKGKWPATMPANCRRDSQFEGVYDDCYICDVLADTVQYYKKPGQRYFALAVLREAVRDEGRILGYKDKLIDVTRKDDKGEEVTTKEKAVVVVNMGWKNFFSILNGYGAAYQTVLDRDYQITRHGEKLDTSYTIIPLDPIQTTLNKGESNEETVPFDLRDDRLMARYLPNAAEVGYARASDERLIQVIAERASDEFYARFFDATKTAPTQNAGGGTGGVAAAPEAGGGTVPTEAPAAPADSVPESVSRLVDRIHGAGPQAYTPQAEEAPAAAAAPVPAAAGVGQDFS